MIVKSAGADTVKIVVPEILPEAAVIVVVPCATPVARPEEGLIVATDVLEDVQVTDDAMSFVVVSE